VFPNYLSGLSHFFVYFSVAVLMLGVFWSLYTFLTPHDELRLIREGNSSAALAIFGALLGFSIPLAAAIVHNVSPMAVVQWALVASGVQLAVYAILRLLMRDISEQIAQDKISAAIMLGGLSVICGILNAAAISV
jgi:putative membrane protein